jgi:hypothetical protein
MPFADADRIAPMLTQITSSASTKEEQTRPGGRSTD